MRIYSLGLVGIQPFTIEIEAAHAKGLPSMTLLGLPSEVARDLRERVHAALLAIGDRSVSGRWTLSVSADIDVRLSRLGATCLDLPVALLMMAAHNKVLGSLLRCPRHRVLAAGELSLSGALRPLQVWAPLARWGEVEREHHGHSHELRLFTPSSTSPLFKLGSEQSSTLAANDTSEALHGGAPWRYALGHLAEVTELVNRFWPAGLARANPTQEPRLTPTAPINGMSSGLGAASAATPLQRHAPGTISDDRRAQMVESARDPFLAVLALSATVGRLHVLLAGPPGAGKTYLADLMAAQQSAPTPHETSLLALIHGEHQPIVRPTRKPHHSATLQSLTGGARLNIGELGLAHAGILLLDELPEFSSSTLDALREPLDEGKVRLSRAGGQLDYPAQFQLVATMNPCPCGYFMSATRRCRCVPSRVRAYLGKANGPLLDRFHVLAWVDPLDPLYSQANRLCALLLNPTQHGVTWESLASPGSLEGPEGQSNRSRERVQELASCLEALFPASPHALRQAVMAHLRRFLLLMRESESLV